MTSITNLQSNSTPSFINSAYEKDLKEILNPTNLTTIFTEELPLFFNEIQTTEDDPLLLKLDCIGNIFDYQWVAKEISELTNKEFSEEDIQEIVLEIEEIAPDGKSITTHHIDSRFANPEENIVTINGEIIPLHIFIEKIEMSDHSIYSLSKTDIEVRKEAFLIQGLLERIALPISGIIITPLIIAWIIISRRKIKKEKENQILQEKSKKTEAIRKVKRDKKTEEMKGLKAKQEKERLAKHFSDTARESQMIIDALTTKGGNTPRTDILETKLEGHREQIEELNLLIEAINGNRWFQKKQNKEDLNALFIYAQENRDAIEYILSILHPEYTNRRKSRALPPTSLPHY